MISPSKLSDDEDDIPVVQVSAVQSVVCPCCGMAILEFYGSDGRLQAVVSMGGDALIHLAIHVDDLCEDILEMDMASIDTIGPTAGRA